MRSQILWGRYFTTSHELHNSSTPSSSFSYNEIQLLPLVHCYSMSSTGLCDLCFVHLLSLKSKAQIIYQVSGFPNAFSICWGCTEKEILLWTLSAKWSVFLLKKMSCLCFCMWGIINLFIYEHLVLTLCACVSCWMCSFECFIVNFVRPCQDECSSRWEPYCAASFYVCLPL